MNNMQPIIKTTTKIPFFRRAVLQNFPFIEQDFDALTDYELLCKVVEYLNEVIRQTNLMEDNENELVRVYNELYNYVDNYFDNLDVQEEINNKLDEMVEDGTLQEIITDYLNSKAIFGYDNVASMKNATNLINGSYARTLGYYEKNDGGSSTYFIRNKNQNDIEDNSLIIFISNDLVAELVIEDYMQPEQFGCRGDGTTDDNIYLTKMLNSNCNNFICNNTYNFTNITISNKKISIKNGIFKGRLYFNNCDYINLENINFISNNVNYDEIIKIDNSKNININSCKFDGDLVKSTTKGLKIINCIYFECKNTSYNNFDGNTDYDILPNGNSAGNNSRNQTTGIFIDEVTNSYVYNCNFNNILGRSGIYIKNSSNIEVLNSNFNYIYGSAIHIGDYFKNIIIKNNYLNFCAITGRSSTDFLYLNGASDGAIDVYGAENYLNYLSTDSNIEISNNYFYECGTREGISTDYYVYTDNTKTTLATTYSNGEIIGEQPLTATTRLSCIRLLNCYKADVHDNLIVNPHNHIVLTNFRRKYSTDGNNYTYTNVSSLKIKLNKIILNDYADIRLYNLKSVEFTDNIIEAISTNSEYISIEERSIDASNTKYLVSIYSAFYSNVSNNLILTDVYSGIYNDIASHSKVNNNAIEVWSFGIYIPKFVSLKLDGNMVFVGRQVIPNPTEDNGMDSGGIYVNQSATSRTVCVICNNISSLINTVANNVLSKSNVNGVNANNISTNDGAMFPFGTATTIFPVNLPIDNKYYIEYSDNTKKEFNYQ